MATFSDENIGGLNVAMDDVLGMRSIQGIGNLGTDIQNSLEVHWPACNQMLERVAFEILHGDEQPPLMLGDLIDGANVGVIQSRGGAGFATKTLEGLRILGNVIGQKFEGDEAAEFCVFGLVNNAHATTAELLNNAVVRDGLADHFGFGLQC